MSVLLHTIYKEALGVTVTLCRWCQGVKSWILKIFMFFLSHSVVDCGQPASMKDAVLLSVTGTTYSSVAMFVCDEGFVWRSGDNSSVCGADGRWTGPTMVCEGNKTQAEKYSLPRYTAHISSSSTDQSSAHCDCTSSALRCLWHSWKLCSFDCLAFQDSLTVS